MQDDLHGRLLGRDPTALDQLIDQHIDQVHWLVGLILGRVGSPEDVEEAVADVFARAWDRAAEFDPARTTLRSWLLMLAKYTALDHRKRLVRRQYTAAGSLRLVPLDGAPEAAQAEAPEEELLRRESADRLRRALQKLPHAEQELLVRRYFLAEPIAEIAREMGLSRSAIDNRLWRARQALKDALTALEGVHEIG